MTRVIDLNPDELTLGDLELFEEATGLDLMEALKPIVERDPETDMPIPDPDNPGKPKMTVKMTAKAFLGLIYVVVKREDPTVTVADLRKMKLNDFEFNLDLPNPTKQKESDNKD